MGQERENPFRPGWGEKPPHRAGHEDAVSVLAERLRRIGRKTPGGAVVMSGPRGNGKTVLLWELARMADGSRVRHEPLRTEMMTGDPDILAERLAPRRRISLVGIVVRWLKESTAGGHGLSAGVELRGPTKTPAWDALHATLQEEPVLLTVDEAHEMPVDFGRGFLQAAQDFVAAGLPLFVVLAGTPGLPDHLGKMRASFVERSTKLRIGRLETAEAAADALAKPAEDSGMPIDGDALALLVEESQRYPFFVQTFGHESWGVARGRGEPRRITLEDARKGIDRARGQLWDFYADRRREVGRQDVLDEAEAVSRMVDKRGRDPRLTTAELVATVRSVAISNGRDPGESLERLMRLGLVWEVPGANCWEPGIPSLCRFLVEQMGVPVVPAPKP